MPDIRIGVVTPQYAPDLGPSAPVYTSLCEGLQRRGHDVRVVTAVPHYGGARWEGGKPWRVWHREERNGVPLVRVPVVRDPRRSTLRRLLYHASFNAGAAWALARLPRPDVLLADGPALWSGIPLLTTAIRRRIPFVYVLHDIYPDVLVQLGIVSGRRAIAAVEAVEQFFYRRMARASVLSEGARETLVRKGVPADKVAVIPIGVDVEFLRPLPRQNALRAAWGLQDEFTVLHAGNVGLSQDLETLVRAAAAVKDRGDIRFVVVGEGPCKPELERLAAGLGASNIQFRPFQPREDLPYVYALADVCLVSLKSSVVSESVPSKAYSILASGRPMIAQVHEASETSRLVRMAECGLRVAPGDVDGLVAAILSLCRDRERAAAMGMSGRRFAEEHHSTDVVTRQYEALLQEVVRGVGHGAAAC